MDKTAHTSSDNMSPKCVLKYVRFRLYTLSDLNALLIAVMYVFQTPSSWSEPLICSRWNKEINLQFDSRDKQEGQDADESSWGMAKCLKFTTNKTYINTFYHMMQTCSLLWCWVPWNTACLQPQLTVLPWGLERIPSSCLNTADVHLFMIFRL